MSLQMLPRVEKRSRLFAGSAALILLGLIGVGVFAQNGWLPFIDGLTGAKNRLVRETASEERGECLESDQLDVAHHGTAIEKLHLCGIEADCC